MKVLIEIPTEALEFVRTWSYARPNMDNSHIDKIFNVINNTTDAIDVTNMLKYAFSDSQIERNLKELAFVACVKIEEDTENEEVD